MPLDWSPFVDLVRRHQRFVLTTHVRPDGDGLGSMLALADVLEAPPLSKTVRMTVASALPPRYDFLDPARRVRRFEPPGDALPRRRRRHRPRHRHLEPARRVRDVLACAARRQGRSSIII